ncbi:MAG: hypothetical protein M3378_05455 [Actinomycetota bacterium]|nr:hypothetical protein [Actinomycetota bacterium]
MARIIDTTPAFDQFASSAFLESPIMRGQQWVEQYEGAHPDVFEAFYAEQGQPERGNPLVRELSRVRQQAAEGGAATREAIEEVEPAVAEALGLPPSPSPLHVLMVGQFNANALVGRLGGEVTLFHCLEWFQSKEGTRVLVAHEDAHAWHEIALGEVPPEDPVWTAFSEGLAIQASRAVLAGRPEDDYFWYGHAGFEDWLPWCREHRDQVLELFKAALEDPEASDTFFGGGLVEGRWRVGYFVADEIVRGLDRPLPELAAMSIDNGRAAVREWLGVP